MDKITRNSWVTTAVILLAGFLLVHFKFAAMGGTFFTIFPFAVGFSIGTHQNRDSQHYMILVFGIIIFFGLLLVSALEGMVCVLMALPIFLLMVWIGNKFQKKIVKKDIDDHLILPISLMPLVLLMLLDPIEQMILPEPTLVTIENSIVLDYAPELVFDQVKQMDKLDAEKPWLMTLGLPSPYQCILEADTIGAKRHCLFHNGKIVAQITKYEKGKILEMDVIDYTLTGKDWFQFVDATYTFEEIDSKTKITRTSSYKSTLNPRIYWEPLESFGIAQEHEFVLNSLKKNLQEKYGHQ